MVKQMSYYFKKKSVRNQIQPLNKHCCAPRAQFCQWRNSNGASV